MLAEASHGQGHGSGQKKDSALTDSLKIFDQFPVMSVTGYLDLASTDDYAKNGGPVEV